MVVGFVEDTYCFKFIMRPGKKILFWKFFALKFYSLKITFKNSAKVGFNIFDTVNAAEITGSNY